jgi:hypothetical protein
MMTFAASLMMFSLLVGWLVEGSAASHEPDDQHRRDRGYSAQHGGGHAVSP